MNASSLRCWAEIDLSALRFNLRRLRSLCSKRCSVVAVVKADAYGHGLFAVVRALADEGVDAFAVANLVEAEVASRAAPRADVLILSPLLPEEYPAALGNPRWIFTISNSQELNLWEKHGARLAQQARLHLKVDTGMGRVGCQPAEALHLIVQAGQSRCVRVEGMFSHLATADSDMMESRAQMKRFRAICLQIRAFASPHLLVHVQNSPGILRLGKISWVSWVRPGLSLYGISTPPEAWKKRFGSNPLRPVLAWKARVALIQDLPRGASISYQQTFRAHCPMRVGILAAGYADGISRTLSNRGEVLIRGQRCPILGKVTMDMTVVDLRRVPSARWGDVAVLIGRDKHDQITAEEMAGWAETIPYEVLCNISKRVPRLVLD